MTHEHSELTPSAPLAWCMAVACGLSVANIYYAQPLLDLLTRSFDISSAGATSIITVTQLGYAAGLVFIVPVGDFFNRRRLITLVCLVTALALAAAVLSPAFGYFVLASFVIGLAATSAQIMVPMAATLAAPMQRGAVVGRVMSGLLIGILLARAFAGIVADIAGWRAVFGCAALAMLTQTIVLWRVLPDNGPPANALRYGQVLRSVGALLVEEPLLRRRIVYGAFGFAGFTITWTVLPFLLADAPYHYSETTIGLFSLFGAAGALGASLAGRFHDAGYGRWATGAFLCMACASFVFMGLNPHSLGAIIAGLLLMDLGVQGVQILNQSTIYALRPDARSRITTAYMGTFFLFGALGSLVSGIAYEAGGWPGALAVAALLEGCALAFWCTEWRARPGANAEP